jgi:hypothetical protein
MCEADSDKEGEGRKRKFFLSSRFLGFIFRIRFIISFF